jgi:hypothetical protein
MTEIPQITLEEERRMYERRKGWHTPETCEKVNGVQAQVEAVKKQLEEAHKKIDSLESKLDENTKATDKNNKATSEILEIVQMGKGVFKFFFITGKLLRKIVMWIVPPVVAIIGLWQSIKPTK